ncbi:MAG: hypothetical protein JWM23_567 [Microbacteriaceae bacterium]|nr:hypothetical protein [Microbacteriaceae bacterium]
MDIQIPLSLPASQYRALTAIADRRGINAHTLIEQLVEHALTPRALTRPEVDRLAPRRPSTPAKDPVPYKSTTRSVRDQQFVMVLKLHGKGWSDREVAAALDISVETARHRRVQLKLAANGKAGRPRKNTKQEERTS